MKKEKKNWKNAMQPPKLNESNNAKEINKIDNKRQMHKTFSESERI